MAKSVSFADAVRNPSNNESTTSPEPIDHNNDSAKRISVKFNFKEENDDTSTHAKRHRDLLIAMTSHDAHLVVLDKSSKPFIPKDISCDEYANKFDYAVIKRRHANSFAVTHDIISSMSLPELNKKLSRDHKQARSKLSINKWKTLDVRDVGWLFGVHPTFHNRDSLTKTIRKELENKEENVPQFRLYAKLVISGTSSTRITSRAVFVECESKHLPKVRHLFSKLYKSNLIPGKFIPLNIQHTKSVSVYKKWITKQSEYLENHRNITIRNVSKEDFNKSIKYNNSDNNMRTILHSSHLIDAISPTNESSSEGKWHISTSVDRYKDALSLIHEILANHLKHVGTEKIPPIPKTDEDDDSVTAYTCSLENESNDNTHLPTKSIISSLTESEMDSLANSLKARLEIPYLVKTLNNLTAFITDEIKKLENEVNRQIGSAVKTAIRDESARMRKTIDEMQGKVKEELQQELKAYIITISPNPRFRKQSRLSLDSSKSEFEAGNKLFEENMTTRPDSPLTHSVSSGAEVSDDIESQAPLTQD